MSDPTRVNDATTRLRIRVAGVVQGVGFRPYVHGLAGRCAVAGFVCNDAAGVLIEAEGDGASVEAFVDALPGGAPPLAVIDSVTVERVRPLGDISFSIAASAHDGARSALVSPDVSTCSDCLRELFDPGDRRFRYPFVNCTNCGPRFTIVRGVPYDRATTTMAGFAMCEACAREYRDPTDRRFHAEPLCCPACGPRLELVDRGGLAIPGDPIVETARRLRDGDVVAIKGLGGYHLAAIAADDGAVSALRARKHREEKPFAVMAADVEAARALAVVDDAEAAVLTSPPRPIVLLRRRAGAHLSGAVAPCSRVVGVMLPYTPLHHLLAAEIGAPFVLTSGNVSDEPIAYEDDDARTRLAGIADAFLVHDRRIHIRNDDSVVRVVANGVSTIRRSRGYAPEPVPLPVAADRPILAVGAELKNTFALARGDRAFVSHHIGDLENYETLRSFVGGIAHYQRLFDVEPELVAHDLHPEYLSTKHAVELGDAGLELVGVQHHHAHIASCLADNGRDDRVIGVAFDGLGYGTDATMWGGEILVADLAEFTRVGHLEPVPMPGGAAAIREPWRMAAVWIDAAFGAAPPGGLAVQRRHGRAWGDVLAVAQAGVNAPTTSSAGRLFDAVAAISGVRDAVTYEGQAAIDLEQLVDADEHTSYRAPIVDGSPFVIGASAMVRAATDDVVNGVPAAVVAARFHNGLADAIAAACAQARAATGPATVALSGGVFQNAVLLERVTSGLAGAGFDVLTHHRVPPNDGGISVGQASVAAAQDRRARGRGA